MRRRVIVFVMLMALMITIIPTNVFAAEEIKTEEKDGTLYVVDQDGNPVSKGWHEGGYGRWYYAEDGGKAAIGWRQIGGQWYYFLESGHMNNNEICDGGEYYLFKESGAMRANEWCELSYQVPYYEGRTRWAYAGGSGALAKGWRQLGGKWYYFLTLSDLLGSDGIHFGGPQLPVASDSYIVTGDELHAFDSSCAWTGRVTSAGWVKEQVREDYIKWRYVDENGKVAIGWKKINGKWYYFNDDDAAALRGVMESHKTIDDSGVLWYLEESGELREKAGWVKPGEEFNWLYLNGDGSVKLGWVKDGANWYYIARQPNYTFIRIPIEANMLSDITGYPIDGKLYAFNADGSMRTGWVQEGEAWYYCGADGAMYTDGTYTISGVSYTFDANGVMQ